MLPLSCVQPVNTISASHSRCHVPLRDNHACAICYTKCLVLSQSASCTPAASDRLPVPCRLTTCRQEGARAHAAQHMLRINKTSHVNRRWRLARTGGCDDRVAAFGRTR